MYSFLARQNGRFSCEADFASGAYLNLHFFDAEQRNILFHLSVRRDEGLIVVNRRGEAGWRREIQFPHPFAPEPVPVELDFGPRGVTVRVDGRRVGRFGPLPHPHKAAHFMVRPGFPKLDDIAYVDIEGPCRADTVRIDMRVKSVAPIPSRGLFLSDDLDIGFAGLTRAERAVMQGVRPVARLRVAGCDEAFSALMVHNTPRGAKRGDLAIQLPGRIWDQGPDGRVSSLSLTLESPDGAVLGGLELEAEVLAHRIGTLADQGAFIHGDRLALMAIEHARHAGLLALLSFSQRHALLQAAEHFGLVDYLLDGGDARDAVSPSERPVSRDAGGEAVLTELRKRFSRLLASDGGVPDPVAVLDRLQREAGLSHDSLGLLLLTMSEWFCLQDRAMELARYRRDSGFGPLPRVETIDDVWTLSALLPFRYAEGDFGGVAASIARMGRLREGWVLTPAIGWIARRVAYLDPDLDGHPIPPDLRHAVVEALIDWIESRAEDYWQRSECVALIEGVVALLSQCETLAAKQQDLLVMQACRVYGLSVAFWEAVQRSREATGWALPVVLMRAWDAFGRLRACVETDGPVTADRAQEIGAVLDWFRQLGVYASARFRRDLLGPSGVALEPGVVPDIQRSMMAGLDPYEALIRHLAQPRLPSEEGALPEDTRRWIRNGVARGWIDAPPGPYLALQIDASRRAMRYLDGDAMDESKAVDALKQRLSALAGPASGFLGVALAVSLACALLKRGREAEAASMAEHAIALVEGVSGDVARARLAHACAPTLALKALETAFPGHPVAGRAATALRPHLSAPPSLPDLAADRAQDLSQAANPLFDTLVCVYSCRANLDTRIAAIRAGWMRQLEALGVAVLVFVGDGDGRREGDVVHLDAPDDYESLPQKSLAMARWVFEHTRFSYLLKIDDDCFLNAPEFFESLSHLRVDYHGRALRRARGQMDRRWHMAKSRSARGRLELDKSPEPSSYADGGSGYTLSRRAMAALIEVADSYEGQALTGQSFMEDKLVGDLLSLREIRIDSEDYRVSVLRRTRPGGPLVAQWENGFLPFADSGIKLAHLDGHEKQAEILAASASPWPKPHKIWPSFLPARLGARTNALDLVSPVDRLRKVNEAEVALVACQRNEMAILPRFLDHYRALGVTGFLIADNGSDDGGFEYLAEQSDVALFAVDTDYSRSHFGVAWQQALMANLRCGRWSLVADADEFLFWTRDRRGSLPALTRAMDAEGADTARVFMLDMYPQGPLSEADFVAEGPFQQAPFVDRAPFLRESGARGPFSNSATWTSALRHRLIPGSRPELFVAQKYALLKYRPWMTLSAGLHFVANTRVSRQELFFGHFKYNAAFHAKAQAEVARKQHFNDAEEYRKYLALVSEGRDVVFDPEVSVRWDACDAILERLASE